WTTEEQNILAKISSDSTVHIDELVEGSKWSVSEMLTHLLNLELKGYVIQLAGKNFIGKDS
ncbi:MAG: DNA-protecting protein DprA, partial [Acidobacteriota bacterium]